MYKYYVNCMTYENLIGKGAAKRYITYKERKRSMKFTRVMARISSLLSSNQLRIFETYVKNT